MQWQYISCSSTSPKIIPSCTLACILLNVILNTGQFLFCSKVFTTQKWRKMIALRWLSQKKKNKSGRGQVTRSLVCTLCAREPKSPGQPPHTTVATSSLPPNYSWLWEKHLISPKSPHNQNKRIVWSWIEPVVFLKKLKERKKKKNQLCCYEEFLNIKRTLHTGI